jgi:hypothetical protein
MKMHDALSDARNCACDLPIIHRKSNLRRLDAYQNRAHTQRYSESICRNKKGRKVGSIAIMLLLLVGFFALFAGLVFFSKGVIEPDSTS